MDSILVYTTFGTEPDVTSDLWLLPLLGEREAFPFLKTGFHESQGQSSPDGRWLAYASNESGRPEVYFPSFPDAGVGVQVSTNGGPQPRWRGDGQELYYLSLDPKLLAAEIITEPTLRVGTSRNLFGIPITPTTFANPASIHEYDVAEDGEHFLLMVPPEDATVSITVVLNWTAGLQR